MLLDKSGQLLEQGRQILHTSLGTGRGPVFEFWWPLDGNDLIGDRYFLC